MAKSKLLTIALLRASIRNKTEQLSKLKNRMQESGLLGSIELVQRKQLEQRRGELGAMIEVINDKSTPEQKRSLERLIDDFRLGEDHFEQYCSDKRERAELESAIAKLQAELDALVKNDGDAAGSGFVDIIDYEGDDDQMDGKKRSLGLNRRECASLVAMPEVKKFLDGVRAKADNTRSVSDAALAVPPVLLGIIRENIAEYSKLISRVRLAPAGGTAREVVSSGVPEAVWMEMTGALNELVLSLFDCEVDGYAVGGFIPLSNSVVKGMAQVDLLAEVMHILSASIGYALDKAILYGTGVKMPLGVVTRLAQTSKPGNYPATARSWADLHTSNLIAVRGGVEGDYTELKGIPLYRGIANAFSNAKGYNVTSGASFWAMSKNTWLKLVGSAVLLCSDNDIEAMKLPAIGGDVLVLDFVPDGEIVAGYADCYLLAEREGISLYQSEHARFLQRQTVLTGEARYDGTPIIAEAFIAIAIDGGEVTTSIEFASDSANT